MDITKVSADILDGPNWGTWAVQIQAAARVLNCWAVIKGERIPGVSPPTYDLLQRPVQGNAARQICQTRIGIGVTLAYKSLSYRSDSRVRGDCDRRPVPVCEGFGSKYLRSIGDPKFSRKSDVSACIMLYIHASFIRKCMYLFTSLY